MKIYNWIPNISYFLFCFLDPLCCVFRKWNTKYWATIQRLQYWFFNFIFFFFNIIIWQCCSISTCWLENRVIEKLELNHINKIWFFWKTGKKCHFNKHPNYKNRYVCHSLFIWLFFLFNKSARNCVPDMLDLKYCNFPFLAAYFLNILKLICVRDCVVYITQV